MPLKNLSLTHKALWLVAIVSMAVFFIAGRWHRGKVVDQDVISYYSYLPAVVVHGDIRMLYAPGNPYYADKVWGDQWGPGWGMTQKYTMGMSWLYAPAFLVGHVTAWTLGYPADGYTTPYMFWLQLSAIVWLLLGLHWLRKALLHYFSERLVATVLLILAFGTNLFYYTHGQAAMPHVYLFALVSAMLLLTIRFYGLPGWRNALLLGLVCSLIAFVRPNHVLLWLVPIGYGLTSKAALKERLVFWRRNLPKMLLLPLIQALIVVPQLIYWKMLTDHWLYYSYGGEGFFWNDPAFLEFLFSYRKGWLLYTPLMVPAVAGLLLLHRRARDFSIVVPVVLVAGTYVMACWWSWWYGGSFGQRVMIEFYPLLALPMAAALSWLFRRLQVRGLRIAAGALIGFFVLLNLFQTFQFTRGVIHYDSMTARAYWRAFGRPHRSPTQAQELAAPDYEAAKRGDR